MDKVKPHIQFTSGELLNRLGLRVSPPHWYCMVPAELFFAWGAYGSGKTPSEAYAAWAAKAKQRVES